MSVIDDYLITVPEQQRTVLQHVRQVIADVAPDAEEVISYGMPGFKYKKKYLVTFGSFKDHMSIFPGASPIAELEAELALFRTSKGTIQFTAEHQLPDTVIRMLVQQSMAAIDTK